MSFRKAQVQAITMVLMAGVVISLVGVAWMWGKPMIEKRSTVTDVATAEEFVLEVDKQIVDVARSGGSKSVRIPSMSGAAIKVNATDMPEFANEIVYQFTANQAFLDADGGSIPVETYDEDTVGQYGGSPRIIKLYGYLMQNNLYMMSLSLKYRMLEDLNTNRGYRILINDGGRVSNMAPNQITVTFLNTTTQSNGCCSGNGDVLQTWVNVTIS